MRVTGAVYSFETDLQSMASLCKKLPAGTRCVLLLCCSENAMSEGDWRILVRSMPLQIWGGLFPIVIHNKSFYQKGAVAIGFGEYLPISYFKADGTSSKELRFRPADKLLAIDNCASQFILGDSSANHLNSAMDRIYDTLGSKKQYIGCVTGSLGNPTAPSIITEYGLERGVVLSVGIDAEIHSRHCHGWQKHTGPITVTRAEGSTIHELNYRPAAETYRELLGHIPKNRFKSNFFDFANQFPFGIEKLDGTLVVRDARKLDGQSITLVSNVSENSILHILNSRKEHALDAAQNCVNNPSPFEIQINFLFECSTRAVFLREHFPEEIRLFYEGSKNIPLVGALSIADISGGRGRPIDILNRSCLFSSIKKEAS